MTESECKEWRRIAKEYLLRIMPDVVPWPEPKEFISGRWSCRREDFWCCCTLGWARWLFGGDPHKWVHRSDVPTELWTSDPANVLACFVLWTIPQRNVAGVSDVIFDTRGAATLARLWSEAMIELGYEQEDRPWHPPPKVLWPG